ncbi:DUF2332 domain-containing protein [Exiguobacterium sp.]|uniref:DUF2332 domain-containing protein n=1 Tax=Exiguobacterium sp. TaxID=44751 RepID=UPI00307D498E
MSKINQKEIAERFIRFADNECVGSSRLYEVLARETAQNEWLLSLCEEIPEGQPAPNLLFAAVHELVLQHQSDELATYYPSATKNPKQPENAFPSFLVFCHTYEDEIRNRLMTRRVQTNEIQRCSYLYPIFSMIQQQTKRPLGLLEIGTSAGLQLFVDQYAYVYNDVPLHPTNTSSVTISATVESKEPIHLETAVPFKIGTRLGVDLNVIDLTDEAELSWLNALIWPEHDTRRQMLDAAMQDVNFDKVTLIEGDGVTLLHELAMRVPDTETLCIFHTHVANQMPRPVKEELLEQVKRIGQQRDVFHIYNNVQDRFLHVDMYQSGRLMELTYAETEGHGRAFRVIRQLESLFVQA